MVHQYNYIQYVQMNVPVDCNKYNLNYLVQSFQSQDWNNSNTLNVPLILLTKLNIDKLDFLK